MTLRILVRWMTTMLDLTEIRQLLGPVADTMSDEELERIRTVMYGFADACFDRWLGEFNPCAQPILPPPV